MRFSKFLRSCSEGSPIVKFTSLTSFLMQHRIQRPGREGAKKHEIYVATFGGHLFYDLFVQGWGGGWFPRHSPGSATVMSFSEIGDGNFKGTL